MNDDKNCVAHPTTNMHISVNYIDFARGLYPGETAMFFEMVMSNIILTPSYAQNTMRY